MKSFVFGLIATLLTICTATAQTSQRTLPDVDVKTLSGETVDLQTINQHDGPVVLTFWATWCGPCKVELDAYAKQYPEWKEKYNLEVYAVSIDNARMAKRVKSMMKKKKWPFKVLVDTEGASQRALGFQGIPQTYAYDKTGKLVYSQTGYMHGAEQKMLEILGLTPKN